MIIPNAALSLWLLGIPVLAALVWAPAIIAGTIHSNLLREVCAGNLLVVGFLALSSWAGGALVVLAAILWIVMLATAACAHATPLDLPEHRPAP